jgi:hypothetical protein
MTAIAPYLVAFSALAFCALTAVVLIRTVSHFDPPEEAAEPDAAPKHVAA